MLASDVLTRVRLLLQDPDGVRWLDAEQFQWLTDGQRAIVVVRPDASAKNAEIELVAGSKQTLPDDGLRLLDVVRNVPVTAVNSTTQTGGRAVRLVDREVLDSQDPSWHIRKAATGDVPAVRRELEHLDPGAFSRDIARTAAIEALARNPDDNRLRAMSEWFEALPNPEHRISSYLTTAQALLENAKPKRP